MRIHKASMHLFLTNHCGPAALHYRLWLAVATAPVGGQLHDRACVTAGVPLLFMTNMGADPSQELQEVAASLVGSDAYHQLAMGQGQTQPALDMLQACARSGELPHEVKCRCPLQHQTGNSTSCMSSSMLPETRS